MIDSRDFALAKEAITASSKHSEVMIGCDSIRFKKQGRWFARYSVVVVLHIDGNKGCKLFHASEVLPDYGNLKMRLMTEVGYAVACATEIADYVDDRPFSVHLDINRNPKHKSNVAMKEAIGYVRGTLGFDPMLKPESMAASHCADHVVRKA
jgi:predicted RNase H-related nuclease YkuK (DUF458 family)